MRLPRSPAWRLLVALALMLLSSQAQADEPQNPGAQPPRADSDEARKFGYPSVEAALAALKARADVHITERGGWTIVDDKPNHAIWSFTPPGHPAHPAAVKRVIAQDANGNVSIVMTGLCQAEKAACDKLMADFQALNDRIRQTMQARSKKGE